MAGVAGPRRTRHDQAAGALGPAAAHRRHALGLTQHDLALLAGVGERSIQALEAGKLTVRTDIVMKILDPLGLALAVLPKSRARQLTEAENAVVLAGTQSRRTGAGTDRA